MTRESVKREESEPIDWEPRQYLRTIDQQDADLSRGFLRCRPEKWFPGFAAHWLPLAHSLGVESRIIEVKPLRRAPRGIGVGFYGIVDQERLAVYIDSDSVNALLSAVSPGASRAASSVVLEYLVRRFFSSLSLAWSGPDSSSVLFAQEAETQDFSEAGAVKFSFIMNNSPCHVWVLLGQSMVERLDGLWRRQVKSTHRLYDEAIEARIEVAERVISQSKISEYTKRGSLVDLDVVIGDSVTLLHATKPWLPGRLCVIGNNFGIETMAVPLTSSALQDGDTRLSFQLGSFHMEPALASEMTQIGAVLQTPIALSSRVEICANDRKISEGQLCVNEGRFAVKID